MLSRFDLIGQTDRQTDKICYINIARVSMLTRDKNGQKFKQVRQQDAYLAIRPAYPWGCCPRAAKRIKKLHALLVSLYF